ncbi:MAG TPA: hypothetical protein VM388_15005, partial [Acidimicrobiales bacterium]|nr:hypothetical protein [Acidimicrobiales bacterium]
MIPNSFTIGAFKPWEFTAPPEKAASALATVVSPSWSASVIVAAPEPYAENGCPLSGAALTGDGEKARSPPNTIAAVNSPTARVLKRCSFARGLPPESLTPVPPIVSVDLLKS